MLHSPAMPCLLTWRSYIFLSRVLSETNLYMKQGLVWPYLYTLHTAWQSWHGFHDASNTTTRLAPIRFIPRHPALQTQYQVVQHSQC